MPVLKAKIGGQWVEIGQAQNDEVWIGDAPPDPALTTELWADTSTDPAILKHRTATGLWAVFAETEVTVSADDPFVTSPDNPGDLWYDVSASRKRIAPTGPLPPTPEILSAEYVDGGDLEAGTYYFMVTAVNANGESEQSKEYFINLDGSEAQRGFKVHVREIPGVRVYRHWVSRKPHVFTKYRTVIADGGAVLAEGDSA